MSPRRTTLLAAALFAATSAPLAAQVAAADAQPAAHAPAEPARPVADQPAPERPAAVAGPALAAAPAALGAPTRFETAPVSQEDAALQARARNGFSQSQVLMIVGGAALLTGLIIGEDAGTVLAVGGAGVGLYGLYRYLQGR